MKLQHVKTLIYTAFLLFTIAYLLPGCKGEYLSPSNIAPFADSTGGGGTTTKTDTLPSFNSPTGVAVDASGNIFVADWGNNLIREITPKGVVSTFAGSGFSGYTDNTGVLAAFTNPTGLAIDPSGNLFVADAGNNLIREITPAAVVTTIAGSDSSGFANGIGPASIFFNPLGVAVDAHDNVYVADAGNNVIRLIGSGANVSTFAGTVNTGASTTVSPFNNPAGIAIAPSGNLFVANYLDHTILQVSSAGIVSNYAGVDTLVGHADGPAASATFYYPNSVAVDAYNNVYVSDGVNNTIRKITPGGTVSTFAGSGNPGAIDSVGVYASFNGPAGLAFDAAGNLYVADSNNNEIRKITPAGVVSTVAGSGAQGAHNGIAAIRRNKKPLVLKRPSRPRINAVFARKAH